jgi:hypothetical protein
MFESGGDLMDPECGLGSELAEKIEDFFRRFCREHGLIAKTPPHDLAAWVVKELKKGGAKDGR